jgi:hypothetical protein
MHGGRSTGPTSPEGMARMAAAHTTHGNFTAPSRVMQRYVTTLTTRTRLFCLAVRLRQHLPEAMAARVTQSPAELVPPKRPLPGAVSTIPDSSPCNSLLAAGFACGGVDAVGHDGGTGQRASGAGRAGGAVGLALHGRAADRLVALAEAASLAPWRQAIAFARAAKRRLRRVKCALRTAQQAERAAEREARVAEHEARAVRAHVRSEEAAAVRHEPMQQSATVVPAAGREPIGPLQGGEGRAGCRFLGDGGGRQEAECAALFRPTVGVTVEVTVGGAVGADVDAPAVPCGRSSGLLPDCHVDGFRTTNRLRASVAAITWCKVVPRRN